MRLTTPILILATMVIPAFCQEPEKVAICDAFRQPERWIGKMIEIRGIIEPMGSVFLTGRDCRDHVVFGQARFENFINLADPKDKRLTRLSVGYEWSPASWQALNYAIQYSRLYGERITATVIGMFETDTRKEAMVSKFDPTRGMAYGDQGVAPIQILVKELKDIVRQPLPKSATGDRPLR